MTRQTTDFAPNEPPDLTGVPIGGAQATITIAKEEGVARFRLATRDEATGAIEEVWAIWSANELRTLALKLLEAADTIDGRHLTFRRLADGEDLLT
jgi:hypothetical protein